jgi:hypothetical protein
LHRPIPDVKLEPDEIWIRIHRPMTPTGTETEVMLALHRERARLLHALSQVLDMDVRDWGNTDSDRPHETVEIITALGSAGVFTAIAYVLVSWLRSRKITKAEIKCPDGTVMNLENVSDKTFNRAFKKMIEETCQKLELNKKLSPQ